MPKKRFIIIASGTGILVLVAIILLNILKPSTPASATASSAPTSTTADVKAPEVDNTSSSITSQKPTDSEITVDVGGDASKKPTENKAPATKPAKPVTPSKPAQPADNNSKTGGNNGDGGITIGGGASNAGTPETDSFLADLMKKGCPYCGSHTCPSFYAKDDWGNPCYNPKLCSKYDIHKDAVYYCQVCGKKNGDGTNGTCVRFVTDTICPNCGEFVKANTCHTCPKK